MASALRWLSVVPLSAAVAILVMFPWHFTLVALELFGPTEIIKGIGAENIERLGYAFFSPFFVITIAPKIAPSHKGHVSRITCLSTVILIAGIYIFGPSDYFLDYMRYSSGWEKSYPFFAMALNTLAIYLGYQYNKSHGYT